MQNALLKGRAATSALLEGGVGSTGAEHEASLMGGLLGRVRKTDWSLLAALAFAAFLLGPLFKTGYFGDDLMESLFRGMLLCRRQTFLQALLTDTQAWLKAGRFFPLVLILPHSTFYLLSDVHLFKSFIFLLLLSNLALFAYLLRRLTGGLAFSAFSALLVVASFQFRAYYDPILGLYGLMQWLLLGTLLSLLALHQHLRSGKRLWLLLSVLAYLLTLLTYEITYPFIALHALLIFARDGNGRRALRKLLPFGLALAACGAVSVILRFFATTPLGPRYHPNLRPSAYLPTLAKQLFAAVPLSYFSIDPHGLFAPGLLRQNWRSFLLVLIAGFLIAVMLLARLARGVEGHRPMNHRLLIPLGLLLWVLPALLIALSTGYQQDIFLGVGYLPVYIQYYGIGLLGACACALLLQRLAAYRRLRALAAASLALAFALVSSLSYCANQEVASLVARAHGDNRANLKAALQAGLLDGVPPQALVILDHEYELWHAREGSTFFYAQHTGKVLNTVPRSKLGCLPGGPAYEIKDCCRSQGSDYVLLSTLEPLPAGEPNGTRRLTTRQVRLYARNRSGANSSADHFWLAGLYEGAGGEAERFFISANALRPAGGGWGIYSFETGARAVLTDSLVAIWPRKPLELIWDSGFSLAFHPGAQHVRWCGGDGVMCLSNDTAQPVTVRLCLNLLAGEDLTLTVKSRLFEEVVQVAKAGTVFSRVLRLEPGLHTVRFTATSREQDARPPTRKLPFSVIDPFLGRETIAAPASP